MPALVIFTRLFAALRNAGTRLDYTLHTLGEDAPAPYGAAARRMLAAVQGGYTLTAAMTDEPALFPPVYRAFIHAGEMGGLLDEVLSLLAELFGEQWRRRQAGGPHFDFMAEMPAARWSALAPAQQLMALGLWCRALGLLLGAGVPRAVALSTSAELLPLAERDGVRRLAQALPDHGLAQALRPLGFLPATASVLIELGDHAGGLELTLDQLATLYHDWVQDAPQLQSERAPVPEADPALASLIPAHLRRRYRVTPLQRQGDHLLVAMAEPLDAAALDDLRLITGLTIVAVPSAEPGTYGDEDAVLGCLVNAIVQHALNIGAGEIVIAPSGDAETGVPVRLRLGEAWQEFVTLPAFAHVPLINKIAQMAEIPPDATPTRGRIHVRHKHQDYGMLVSVVDGVYGPEMHVAITRLSEANGGSLYR